MDIRHAKSDNKKFLTPVKKAMQQYRMLQPGDRIAVGLSGGKDSSTLFYILKLLQKQLPFEFELVPVCLTLGFEGMDISPLKEYVESWKQALCKTHPHRKNSFRCQEREEPLFAVRQFAKGALYKTAKALECNKAALGHHLDDVIETLLMNLVFNGRLGVFQPKSYLDRRILP